MSKRRLVALSIMICLLAAFAFVAGALPAQADGPIVESVTGSTHMTVPFSVFVPGAEGDVVMRTLSYNALRHADGTVSGQYEYHVDILGDVSTVHGTVICFKAEGNRAWIGATVDRTSDPSVQGLYSWWQVEDKGQGAGDAPDMTTFLGFGTLQETFDYCEGPDPNFIFDIDHGNVRVGADD